MDIFEINGKLLREMRESLDWSREKLAEKSGISLRAIQEIESDKVPNPGVKTIISLIQAMDPENTSSKKEKTASLLLAIVSALPSLNESQLSGVLELIETLPSQSSAKTAVTR